MGEVSNFQYTAEQKKVINLSSLMIKNSLSKNIPFVIKIIGSAGTGKTTVVSGILEEVFKFQKRSITIVAPTHKALSVIKDKIEGYFTRTTGYPTTLSYNTLASVLKMERVYNYDTQTTDFAMGPSTEKYALKNDKLVIIDEASMVTKEQYEMLLYLSQKNKITLIFLGDIKQLPPVKESSSPAVVQEVSPNLFSFTLTEIIRQGADNPILDVAHNLDMVKSFTPHLKNNKGYLFSTNFSAVLSNLSKAGGSSDMKYLSWTNTDVDMVNEETRKFSFGDNPQEIYVGETIISQSNSKFAANNEEILVEKIQSKLSVNSICTTTDLHKLEKKYWDKIEVLEAFAFLQYNLGLVIKDAKLYFVCEVFEVNDQYLIIKKGQEKEYKQVIQILKKLVKEKIISWKELADFEETFLKYKYSYAMSVHKSQGSTFKNVIINLKDIERNKKEYNEILYTAITRASDKVIFYYPVNKNQENE